MQIIEPITTAPRWRGERCPIKAVSTVLRRGTDTLLIMFGMARRRISRFIWHRSWQNYDLKLRRKSKYELHNCGERQCIISFTNMLNQKRINIMYILHPMGHELKLPLGAI